LGGHIVSGHVDGVGSIRSIEPVGRSWHYRVEAPATLAHYIAEKETPLVAILSPH
jgi:riboflavin synthase